MYMQESGRKKIAEGREAEILEWEEGKVLRLYRDPAARTRAMREASALRLVRLKLPLVPSVEGVVECEGRPGLVMERLVGDNMMEAIAVRPWRLFSLAHQAGDIHARLHEVVAPQGVPDLRECLSTSIASARAIPAELATLAQRTLSTLPDGDRLCHGDYQPSNVLMTDRGPVVIDWPDVASGDPMADFARTHLMMRAGDLPPGTPRAIRLGSRVGRGPLRWAYARGYRAVRDIDLDSLRRWELVRAVERLGDAVPEERVPLLRAIDARRG